jgi:hypothetical protein
MGLGPLGTVKQKVADNAQDNGGKDKDPMGPDALNPA